MEITVFDPRVCTLGEGAFWHPERQQLFWFDVQRKRLLTQTKRTPQQWQFNEHVSAAGWIDVDRLLIASETGLFVFDLQTEARQDLVAIEADTAETRSNDGRADPWGGFWIGTMGKQAQPNAGNIYRFYNGKLQTLFSNITIPNAICFAPDRRHAFYTDTPTRVILRQKLDADGWPDGAPRAFTDLNDAGFNPDGAVVDADGYLWVALWGAAQVVRFDPAGRINQVVDLPASQPSCPAFGGTNLSTLFITSACEGLKVPTDQEGQTFQHKTGSHGQAEHRVRVQGFV